MTAALDVSSYQGLVAWEEVYAAGYRVAAVKVSEGLDVADAQAYRNVTQARQAGFEVFVYHFAHPSNSPAAELRWFLEHARGLVRPGDYPPALDLEVAEGHSWEYLNGWKAHFLAGVDDAIGIGHGATFYSYLSFLERMTLWPERPVWGAAFTPVKPAAASGWSLWQHSATGRVPGITGNVDLDVVLKPVRRVAKAIA